MDIRRAMEIMAFSFERSFWDTPYYSRTEKCIAVKTIKDWLKENPNALIPNCHMCQIPIDTAETEPACHWCDHRLCWDCYDKVRERGYCIGECEVINKPYAKKWRMSKGNT